jgi:hypothetical protein
MVRFRLVTVAVLFVGVMPWARTVYAQDVRPPRIDFLNQGTGQPLFSSYSRVTFRTTEPEQAPAPRMPQIPLAPVVPNLPKPSGKTLLNSLYATTIAMQVLDIHSTIQALNSGAVEGNPIIGKVAGNPGALIATKAAVTAVSLWAAHKVSKHNKAAAVITLVAVNSAYAMIVSNNYRLAHR